MTCVERSFDELDGSDGTSPETRSSTARLARAGRWLCCAGAAFGILALVGWTTGLVSLATLVPGQPPMMPNTALCLALVGLAGAIRREGAEWRRALSFASAIVVLAIAVSTLAEYLLAIDLPVDDLVLRVGTHRGPMPPPTAVALGLLAGALALTDARPTSSARPAEWFAMAAGLVALTAMLGQLFGATQLYRLQHAPVIGVAVPTAVALLLLSVGLLLEQASGGVMRVAASSGPGGLLLRRLVPAAILGPTLLNFVASRLIAIRGADDFALVYASLTVAAIVVGLGLLPITARPLDRIHATLEATRARTDVLIAQASDGILVSDEKGRYIEANDAACRLLGYSRDELFGKSKPDLLAPADRERFERDRERLLSGDSRIGEWLFRRKDGTALAVEVSSRILPDGRWQSIVRDMSERKRVQDQLRQSMERFELALHGADLAAWDWNVQTGEIVFNARWAEMRGHRPEEVVPHVDSWIAGIHPEDLPRVRRVLEDHLAGRTPEYETEHRVQTKNGGWLWVLDRGKVFARDDEGRAIRMVGTELDVTSRKRVEEALRISEAKFSGIIASSADAIVSVDTDHRIMVFNEGAERMFGYPKEQALGAPLDILVPAPLRAGHRRHLETFASGPDVARRANERTTVWLRSNGEEFPAEGTISKLDVGGTRTLTITLRDVTERQRREEENELLSDVGRVLGSSLDYETTLQRLAELVVRRAADVCIVDVLQERGEVSRVAVGARHPAHERACDTLRRIELDRKQPHLMYSALETRRPFVVERVTPEIVAAMAQSDEHLRAMQAIEPKSYVAVPLVFHDELFGVICLLSSSRTYDQQDVRLAMELAQRTALWLENARLYHVSRRALRDRDDVLGIVAHDLRNPLAAIVLQCSVLRRKLETRQLSPKDFDAVERATARMDWLIRDLLDVVCLEAGRLGLNRAQVSSRRIVLDSIESQRSIAAARSLALEPELSEDMPEVWADRDRLLQVFENLIGNACKFTDAGGRIAVGARRGDHAVLFWVKDTGIGIPPEHVPHLFDRFWQAQKRRQHGAGLGLPIVKGIIEAHGGRIWVESTAQGSTFFFTIPIPAPLAAARKAATSAASED